MKSAVFAIIAITVFASASFGVIETEKNRMDPYTGDGSQTVFPFDIKIFEKTDLIVTLDGVAQTLDTDYTVQGKGPGNVVMTTPPASGATLFIIRHLPITQKVSFTYPKVEETCLDRLTCIALQIDEAMGSSGHTHTRSQISDLSTWPGTTSINTLGTIGTGVWQGTAIADAYIASAANWNTAYGWDNHATQNYLDLDTYPNADTDTTNDLTTTTSWGGDLSGTGSSPSVVDDSHNHVIANIDGFTEADLQGKLSDVTNVFTNNDGALNDDDVTLGDVQTACTSDFHNIGGTDDDVPDSGDFGAIDTEAEFESECFAVVVPTEDDDVPDSGDFTAIDTEAEFESECFAVVTPSEDDDVPEAADYSNLTGGTGIDNDPTGTLTFDPTEVGNVTWWSGLIGSSLAWTWDLWPGVTDPVMVFGDNYVNVSTGELQEGGYAVYTTNDGSLDDDDLTDNDLDDLGDGTTYQRVKATELTTGEVKDSAIDHDQTTNFVANKHIDWTSASDDIKCDELTLTNGQDYKFSRRSDNSDIMTIQAQDTEGTDYIGLGLYTGDGDGSDNVYWEVFSKGTPGDITTSELMQLRYAPGAGCHWQFKIGATGTGSYRDLKFYNGGVNVMTLAADGNQPVYFPTTWNNQISGDTLDLYIKEETGEIGYISSSAEGKTNVRDYTGNPNIWQLQPRVYDRKDGNATDEVGLIAEEVALVMPELVSYKRIASDPNVTGKQWEVTDIPQAVNYSKLPVRILAELQELKARVDQLEAQVEALKNP